jgi:3-phosphoshikimate 1-carboxyvinyltransferase
MSSAQYPPSIAIQPVDRPVNAVVTVPGSKSITNRALLLAGLADGHSRIEGALFSDDTRYLAAALNDLGIPVHADEADCTFEVDGKAGTIPASSADLFLGNSGTSTRFITAALALGHGEYRVDGVARMRERPIADLLDALQQLGVDAVSELRTGCPPVRIRANGLRGGTTRLRGDASSQFLSALLMVAPFSGEGVDVEIIGPLASQPYVDMTLRIMEQWSDELRYEESDTPGAEDGITFRCWIPAGQTYLPHNYLVEPDASSASYFFAAAAVTGGRVRVEGIGQDALQGDIGFVDVLREMGCEVEQTYSYTEVRGPGRLKGVDVDMNGISDTVMTLAAIAPFASSRTTIRNVANIRVKETDRLRATATELRRLGVEVEELADGLVIQPAASLRPAEIETYDDHRMAMSFAVTGLMAPGIVIKDPGCVAKTVPDFFTRFQALTYRD